MKDKCYVCGIKGIVCRDMIVTADKKIVHSGECHDRLVKRDQLRIDKSVG